MSEIILDQATLDGFPAGITKTKIALSTSALGEPFFLPLIIIKGKEEGKTIGITAAIHGDEVNGIAVIHRLTDKIDPVLLKGTIIAVPIFNIPGFSAEQRYFHDGSDLNRLMPGKQDGSSSEQYTHAFIHNVLTLFNYHLDLHTASFGRCNSFYVRADLDHPVIAALAREQQPEIIVHKKAGEGTLRKAAMMQGIPSLTIELGNPLCFQEEYIGSGLSGILRILSYLKFYSRTNDSANEHNGYANGNNHFKSVLCTDSYWLYSEVGGILEVPPKLLQQVRVGDLLATVKNVYGDIVRTYYCSEDAIVIGKAVNPIAPAGTRIIHLGTFKK